MFDSVGRKGRTKALSPFRWVASGGIGGVLLGVLWGMYSVAQSLPEAKAEEEKEPVEVTFTMQKQPPPPPPPPPPAAPKATTRPLKNAISKKVVQKEIEKPEPTPPPPKDQPTPPPEPELASADTGGGVPGGVPGGVLGGVLGGVVGGTGSGTGDIQEIDFGDITIIKKVPVVYPALAKRNRITGTVIVEVICNPDGSVRDVIWVNGNELFQEAVFSAVRQMQYAPQPIPFRFKQPFKFALN